MSMSNPTHSFCLGFSGIRLQLTVPSSAVLPPEFTGLICEDVPHPDAHYTIALLDSPLTPQEPPHFINGSTKIYRTDQGWLRMYSLRPGANGCQVACLLRPDGNHTLYYPADLWEHYASPLHCGPQMGLEQVFLQKDAFLLHSSLVMLHEKTVLFCGASGMGKSTQADLWQKHLGARILNGDRALIRLAHGTFYAGGSPFAGHSKIYVPDEAPIAGIFLLEQGLENQVQKLGFSAFSPMFSQTLVNSWDENFISRITELYQQLLAQVPVYRLTCRPDEEAVRLAYNTIFAK